MTRERWALIEQLFHSARERDPADRAAYLKEACRNDDELRGYVESLLLHENGETAPLADLAAPPNIFSIEGTELGPYRIEARLGEGGMGVVFRAVDTRLGRKVAIKVSPLQFSQRFEREAQAIAALNHPHVCTLYDVGANYLVMELVEGETLADRLRRGPLPIRDAARYAAQIADALAEAHAHGIIHRDLKPANIMLTRSGVKVLDFGIARRQMGQTGDSLTATGGIIGTPSYMAPEQLAGRETDGRTDIFALGLVLYEMTTGKLPPVRSAEPFENFPESLRPVVERCLAEEPGERWQSAADVKAVLQWTGTRPIRAPIEEPNLPVRLHRFLRLLPWTLAVAGLALGAFGISRFTSPPAPPVVRFGVPIPGSIGGDAMFALSPDGQNLAISASEDGQFRLRVRALDDVEARLLPGTDGARFPFWSPDSTQIGFFAGGNLKTTLITGGEPTIVTPVGPTLLGATWGRKGVIVFSQNRELYKVDERGGKPELLTKAVSASPDKSRISFSPEFLPDGQHFLYVISDGVYVGSIDAGTPVKILPDFTRAVYSPEGYLLFVRQGRLTAQPFDPEGLTLGSTVAPLTREVVSNDLTATTLSAANGGAVAYQAQAPEQLTWVDRSGIVKEKFGPSQSWVNFRLNRDQTKVAFESRVLERGASREVAEVAVFDLRRNTLDWRTSSGETAMVPVFSPDAKQVAFTSPRNGRFNPYVTSAMDPKQERQLSELGLDGGYPVDWSPDGKNLLYWGNEDLWIVPVSGSEKPYAIAQSKFEERAGAFSPDGSWIAYSSDESGRYEIYLQPFPAGNGERHTVSSRGGSSPAWRRDGKELYYVAGDGHLTAVTLTINGSKVEFGRTERLFPVNSTRFHRAYEPSLDGQRFLITMPTVPPSVTVLLNWAHALGK